MVEGCLKTANVSKRIKTLKDNRRTLTTPKMGGMQSNVEQTNYTTPKTPDHEQEAAINDPRSPSNQIKRTPMRVSTLQMAEDPRSPSQQIQRTPLHIEKENSETKELDEVKKTLNYDNVHIDCSRVPLVNKNV